MAAAHPIVDGLGPLEALDERYSYLQARPGSQVLVTQRHDGIDHAVVWVNPTAPYRAVYDALGHDLTSYDSPARRRLLAREALWLLCADPATVRAT